MFKKIYLKIFPDYYFLELEKALSDVKNVLDLGCGNFSPLKRIKKDFYSVGVDGFKQNIEESKKNKIHNEYYKMNVLDIGKKFKKNSFDAVIALDLIEHLTKKEGNNLLKMMEKIAKKKVIVFTPNGFLEQGNCCGNPLQKHKSGWTVKDFKSKSYKVIGIHGWKKLRGELSKIKYKPFIFWRILSDMTQIITRGKPEYAFQILCIKSKKERRGF